MNEIALILEFAAEAEDAVRGRCETLGEGDLSLLQRVSQGASTAEERQRAAVLMRDNEDAIAFFVRLVRDVEQSEPETDE